MLVNLPVHLTVLCSICQCTCIGVCVYQHYMRLLMVCLLLKQGKLNPFSSHYACGGFTFQQHGRLILGSVLLGCSMAACKLVMANSMQCKADGSKSGTRSWN